MSEQAIFDYLLDKIDEKQNEIEDILGDKWGVVLGQKQLDELNQTGPYLNYIDYGPSKHGACGRLHYLWLFRDDEREVVDIEIKRVNEILQIRCV